MRAVVSAGGTGGHITPALAVSEEIIKRGGEVLYIGNKNSMEERIISEAGIEFSPVNVQKLYRKFTFKHLLFPFRFLDGLFKSSLYLQKFKPDFFFGCGGFVSGPPGFAALAGKIPVFLHEQNSYPGLTNRLLAKYARKVFLGMEDGKNFLKNADTEYTGNPVRKLNIGKYDFEFPGFNPEYPVLLILGGSQGSWFINDKITEILDFLTDLKLNIFWQAGENNLERIKKLIGDAKRIHVFGFSSDLDKFYSLSDFVISRSGALSLAELEEFKLPGIIIPLPSSAGNHQFFNAVNFCRNHGILLEQNKYRTSKLKENILSLMENYREIKLSFKKSVHGNAAIKIVDEIYADI
ncbi:MAG: undecaprenyldiphospho-muramoylpentapeptide beta-N-acetylglucosaminyltransferase [Candidatus Cloacimonadota bacterium]|nr:MAG: undecaprenyldiphospho-muramoylpentapeptide beta-N-acetylglucosaminyltransferase [Candidatus Cloacimonadota bacterium]